MKSVPASIEIQAYAKVNLTLEVLHQREDQFHELRSVVQTISLADQITLTPNSLGTKLRLSGYRVPQGDDNLVMTVVQQAADRLRLSRDVEVRLEKRIPPGRGLGGGSSDAAALLEALVCLSGEELREQDLDSLAAETGSDVPLFRRGGTLLMSGRGERVHPLPEANLHYRLVLAWPEVSVPTEVAYGLLETGDFTDGEWTARLWDHLRRGEPPRPEMLYNCFERAVFAQWPSIAALHQRMSELAEVPARMTGTGSAVYALSERPEAVAEALREEGWEAVVAQPVPRGYELSCQPAGGEGGRHA